VEATVRIHDHPDRCSKVVDFRFEIPETYISELGAVAGAYLSDRSPVGAFIALGKAMMLCTDDENVGALEDLTREVAKAHKRHVSYMLARDVERAMLNGKGGR